MKNKKDFIYNKLSSEKIDICALQEVEIQHGYDCNQLSSKDYRLEVEKVSGKARIATAIKNNINYTRRNDLEKEDSSVIIIDLNSNPKLRLINIYRSFNPPKNKNALTAFKEQIEIIKFLYPNMTIERYEGFLLDMIPKSYKQVAPLCAV